MDGEKFQQLWDEILSQPDVDHLVIIAVRGGMPQEGDTVVYSQISSTTDPIVQMQETLTWLKANPYKADKPKRGRKAKS